MKTISFYLVFAALLTTAVVIAGKASAQSATGIKTANLKGADLDLMNNHDPASELENFELLPGYQANLFAADPMFANPVHMHWDSRGRLWVACSWAYPQLKPGDVANDKIIILEDTDDDGVADKSTVFAEGLYLPTGIELANGGCYVGQSPDVFFLKDTDGDDVADVKQIALTGFGIEDSHHSISAWRRGPGGWIYFQEGIFLHTQVETQHGVVRNFNGGVYQFNPRTQQLRMFCRGTGGNPWGHVFDRWGQSFMVNNPRIMYLSPWTGNSGENMRVKPLISTEKQCGGDLATGTHVGDDLRGQLLTGRFKSRAVVRYELMDDGAGFSANVLEPLIRSKHPNFRPVDVKIGPDGAIYVADWYNSIINHAQHDFRDPRRDHDHGRIWRITHKERPLTAKPKLVGVSIRELAENLKSTEAWTRHQARKELSERDPGEVLAEIESWVDELKSDSPDHDLHLVEAMWACQNVDQVSEKILNMVLSAQDGHARSAGARMIRYWHDQLSDPIGMIAKAADDSFARTRMEAVLSAGYVPRAEAFAAALHALNQPKDPMVDLALSQTAKALEDHWRPAMETDDLEFAKASHREFAEQGAGIGLELRLAAFLRDESPTAKEIASMQSQLLEFGTDKDVAAIIDILANNTRDKSSDAAIGLLETLQRMGGRQWPGSLKRKIGGLRTRLNDENDEIALLAATNLGSWRVAGNEELKLLRDKDSNPEVRHAIAVALAMTSSQRYLKPLTDLSTSGDLGTRYAAVAGLAQADLPSGVEAATRLLIEDPRGADPVPIVQTLLKHRKGGQLLTEALQQVKLHPEVMRSIERFHRDTGFLPDALAKKFHPSSSAVSLSVSLASEDMELLTADVEKLGDPESGELIYRRKSLACVSCHAIGSAGPAIGPNLVAVGAAAKTGYVVESILKPNKAIAEHYETKMFLLVDGTVQKGIITFRNDKEVVIRDSAQLGKEVRIAVDDIEEELPAPSLMPAGLADQLNDRGEFLDLAKFVSLLGKAGVYANDERPVIRKWRVTAAGHGEEMPPDGEAWLPAYSKVNGYLPAADFPSGASVFLRGYANVQAAGAVQLDIDSREGLTLWVDNQRINDLAAPIKLDRGRRTLTFALDPKKYTNGLRVELKPADSAVRFQTEGGR